MPIVVYSPFSGKPVKVRDEDIGRALRDEEKRIFYALERPDGEGYYAAPTRAGGPKDLERYDKILAKVSAGGTHSREQQAQNLHDATGRKRANKRGKLVIVILFLIVAAIAYYFWFHLRPQWQQGPPAGDIPTGFKLESPQVGKLESCKLESWTVASSSFNNLQLFNLQLSNFPTCNFVTRKPATYA